LLPKLLEEKGAELVGEHAPERLAKVTDHDLDRLKFSARGCVCSLCVLDVGEKQLGHRE
jgi:hypothetical protein